MTLSLAHRGGRGSRDREPGGHVGPHGAGGGDCPIARLLKRCSRAQYGLCRRIFFFPVERWWFSPLTIVRTACPGCHRLPSLKCCCPTKCGKRARRSRALNTVQNIQPHHRRPTCSCNCRSTLPLSPGAGSRSHYGIVNGAFSARFQLSQPPQYAAHRRGSTALGHPPLLPHRREPLSGQPFPRTCPFAVATNARIVVAFEKSLPARVLAHKPLVSPSPRTRTGSHPLYCCKPSGPAWGTRRRRVSECFSARPRWGCAFLVHSFHRLRPAKNKYEGLAAQLDFTSPFIIALPSVSHESLCSISCVS